MAKRVTCPECGRPIALMRNGKLYVHYAVGTERVCAGSWKLHTDEARPP